MRNNLIGFEFVFRESHLIGDTESFTISYVRQVIGDFGQRGCMDEKPGPKRSARLLGFFLGNLGQFQKSILDLKQPVIERRALTHVPTAEHGYGPAG